MSIFRLLAAALLLSPAATLAQSKPAANQPVLDPKPAATASPEPWRTVPNQSVTKPEDSWNRTQDQHFLTTPQTALLIPPSEPFNVTTPNPSDQDEDHVCFTMRAYVVERDSRDSDATHPRSYSTCQKSSRYHLKGADLQAETGAR